MVGVPVLLFDGFDKFLSFCFGLYFLEVTEEAGFVDDKFVGGVFSYGE